MKINISKVELIQPSLKINILVAIYVRHYRKVFRPFSIILSFMLTSGIFPTLGQTEPSLSGYTIIEDSVFTKYTRWENMSHVYLRNCKWENWINVSGSAVYMENCDHIIFDNCTFKNIRSTTGADCHAFNIATKCDSIVVKNCYFENISADGLQVGLNHDQNREGDFMTNIIIENNKFLVEDGVSAENALDIKGCDNLVFRNNILSGFRGCNGVGCTGDLGNAIVIHRYSSRNILIEANKIYNCNVGISVSSGAPPRSGPPVNVTIRNNFIFDNNNHATFFSKSSNLQVYHNTFGAYKGEALMLNGTIGDTLFANNILGYIDSYDAKKDLVTDSWYHMEGMNNIWVDLESDYFVDALNEDEEKKDFRLTNSADRALRKSIDISSYYEGDLKDFFGVVRPKGLMHDIGAHEYSVDTCNNLAVKGIIADEDSGQSNGSIQIEISGGTQPYNYVWNDSVLTQNRINIKNGNYIITVIDDVGCKISKQYTVKENSSAESGSVKIFPNPAKDYVNININNNAKIIIFDMNGKQVYNQSSNLHQNNIFIDFPSGNYVVHLKMGREVINRILIVE